MNAMPADFQFLRPLWLLGLLAIPPLLWWLRRQRLQRDVWRDAVDAHLLQHLLQGTQSARSGWRHAVPVVAFVLILLALAGPSWRALPQPLWQDRKPLVIAVDLSYASMTADVQPSRLLQARAKIAQILRTRSGGQIALVAFADDAYIVSPLTDDADNVALFLDALSPEVMPRDGNRVDRAIEESVRLLKRAGFGRGDILLITDHPGGAAGSAAVKARTSGYRVSVLGLGTAAGGAYRNGNGEVETAQLEATGLRSVASAGGGNYATITAGNDDLLALGVLQADSIDAAAAQGKRGSAPLDEGFWLLPPLMLLALLAFRRGVLAVVLLAACLPWQPVAAADGSLWQRADQREHVQLQRGIEAYRSGDYTTAEALWRDLPGADAAYNRGNALAKQGRYDDAIAAYDRALQLRPEMRDAAENRKRVDAARKRKPPQDKPQNQQQNQQKNDPQKSPKDQQKDQQDNQQQQSGEDKPRESNEGPKQPPQDQPPQKPQEQKQQKPDEQKPQDQKSQGQKPQDQRSQDQRSQEQKSQEQKSQEQKPQRQSPRSQTTGTPSEPPKAPDEKDAKAQEQAQREADAAQREQMRRAQAKPPEPAKGEKGEAMLSPSKESAADRERRIANEAWLRRVPDDPGGLLRAKFKLEEKRRRREGDR